MPTPKPGKRGFSLIEAAIVLSVIGLVIGSIWVAAANVRQKQQVSTMVAATLSMSEKIRSLYKDHDISDADITAAMVSAGVVPANLVVNGQPTTHWGQPFGIGISAGPPAGISIGFSADLTGATCRLFTAALFTGIRGQMEQGLLTLGVNGEGVSPTDDVNTVMDYCADEGDPDDSTTLHISF